MGQQYRQGDVFFKAVDAPKGSGKRLQGPTLAYGEVTGHSHTITSPSFSELDSVVDEKGNIFIMSPTEEIKVGHEEHGQMVLPAGQWFNVSRQREYDALSEQRERQVAD